MKTSPFMTTLLVEQTQEEVFEAVTNVRGWWSETIMGNSSKLNDEFIFEVKGVHRSNQKLVEVIPNKKIAWLVTESHLAFLKDNREWTGTRVVFEISRQGNKTQLVFVHEGLTQEVECYGVCSRAWTQYVAHSLHRLITTGTGDPNLEGRRIPQIKV